MLSLADKILQLWADHGASAHAVANAGNLRLSQCQQGGNDILFAFAGKDAICAPPATGRVMAEVLVYLLLLLNRA